MVWCDQIECCFTCFTRATPVCVEVDNCRYLHNEWCVKDNRGWRKVFGSCETWEECTFDSNTSESNFPSSIASTVMDSLCEFCTSLKAIGWNAFATQSRTTKERIHSIALMRQYGCQVPIDRSTFGWYYAISENLGLLHHHACTWYTETTLLFVVVMSVFLFFL